MTFTQNDWFILVLPMLSGLGSSLFHPEAACLVDAISGTQKGKAMGTFFLGSHACFTVGSMAAGKRKQPKDTARPQNNWNAFGKLSFIIFARSIDLTILNFFIPIYWISVPGRLQIAAALPFPCFFPGELSWPLGTVSQQIRSGLSRSCRCPFSSWSLPSFFHKQYHPNDSDATPLLLVSTPFPFLRLIVPWSSWDSPTLPATLDLRPAWPWESVPVWTA